MLGNTEQLRLIAIRIKDLRDIAGLSAREVAEKTDIDLAEYEAYETGTRDFSFSHLFNIAEVLGVDISDLLTGESPKLHGYVLTRAGQGLRFKRRREYEYHHLAYNFRDKLSEPFIVTVRQDEPGVAKQAHSHEGQEFDYVLEGRLLVSISGHEMELDPGDCVYYDSTEPHGMKALGGKAARFLAFVF